MASEWGMLAANAGERTADDANRVVELQRTISRCADLDQLRGLLTKQLVELLPVTDRISIALIEPDGEWLRIYCFVPVPEANAKLPRVRVHGTPVGEVVTSGVGRVVTDVRTDPNITFGHASHDGIRSTVSVPLRIGGRVIGAMNAGSKTIGACNDAMMRTMEEIAAVFGPAFFALEQRPTPIAGAQTVAAPVTLPPPVQSRARSIELIGASSAFRSMLDVARRTAHSDVDVLITGETGVGKTALARAIHDQSARRAAPFVTVHLADLTPTLVESELFGYERGAFTGASTSRIGRFESAQGGTILLDEIGETPLPIQAKLLRVIQDRRFERIGANRTVEVDVRIIAATRRDLSEAIRRGEFREDLFFRLNIVPLHVPSLRDRRDDLELLVPSILARIHASDGRRRTLTPAAWTKLRAHNWPGNIRELESVLRRAAILEDADELSLDGIPVAGVAAPARTTPQEAVHLQTLDEHERDYIERVLELRGGIIEGAHGAARILGVPPSTLRSRMKKLGIAVRRTGKGPVVS